MKNIKKNLETYDNAKKIMLKSLEKNKTELVDLKNATDRILAEDIFSSNNIPEFSNSAVDGFGFKNSKKKVKNFRIIGESKPGQPFIGKIKKNEAIKVFTGAYILENINNLDTVSMEEDSITEGDIVTIKKNYKTGANIRIKGEDVKKNTQIFLSGKKIRSVDISQLSSLGKKKVKVYKKLKIGIFSTGDELCSIDDRKKKFQIYDSNKLALCSLFKKIGCEVSDLGIIRDNYIETNKKIIEKSKYFDLLVTSGGISKSETDKIGTFLQKKAKILFWRLSIKPGRPFAFGKIGKTPFIGFPGNPVATVITFFMLVIHYVKKLSGLNENQIIERILPCDFNLKKKKGRTEWVRGNIIKRKNKYFLKKFSSTGSGIISSLTQSQGIIELDCKDDYIKKGKMLKFFRYEDMLN